MRWVPKLRALGGKPELDPRLIALLDTDVRVVVDWNSDASDLDLWVDEPTGERSIYNNPLTAIGGHLSNDMTQGLWAGGISAAPRPARPLHRAGQCLRA